MEQMRVLIVGCGHMGSSHARAYHRFDECEIVGVVSRGPDSRGRLAHELGGVPQYDDFSRALKSTSPGIVCISTYPDTHAKFAVQAMNHGAHVFVEKPLAQTVADADEVRDVARKTGRKVVVGYILRHHPSWTRFVELARTLGKPLVMRMNLNQQSTGAEWEAHKQLLNCLPPIVDCGVHYVDIMCLMTNSLPSRVHAIGARLTEDISHNMYNYGQLQVAFMDGSVGWYEAGWGPMMSETAYFIKDVIGPKGSVSIVSASEDGSSADIHSHTRTSRLRIHRHASSCSGHFEERDTVIDLCEEPTHQDLCDREQRYLLRAIQEDLDISEHLRDAINSLKIVLAADRSHRDGIAVDLN